ncbi:PstS family phosphate ABC transporter substrate-binding protein [Novosphingobium kunmingense]|nr:substrate-binding domain-containing protein [Novosphingobium kunmingense]
MDRLLSAYAKANPKLRRPDVWTHKSADSAMPSLMFAKADMGPITRAFSPAELAPYDHQYRGDMMKAPFVVTIGRLADRSATIAVNKRPDAPLPERVRKFLDFALSDKGQDALAGLPGLKLLGASERLAERAKLQGFVAPLDPGLPAYRPVAGLSGVIRSVGSDGMKDLVDGWECRFAVLQPGVSKGERWEHFGTLNGFHAMLAEEADLAPMGRELWPQEAAAWRSVFASPSPVEIRVARGGFNTPQRTTAQAIFVHPDNPLRAVTLAQLRGVFGANPTITRWGQLGLTGDWAERPIVVRMPPRVAPNAVSFQMLLGMAGWNAAAREAPIQPTAQAVLGDPGAIAFGGLEEGLPGLRALDVARDGAQPPVAMNADNAASGRYPLTRFMYIRLANGKPSAATLQFLRYVLSREGQERVRYSGYFPLTAGEAAQELAKLTALEAVP